MNRGRRLRAPRDDGGVLIDPPWPQLVSQTLRVLERRPVPGGGGDALTTAARNEALAAALQYTRSYRDAQFSPAAFDDGYPKLVLAGHQPELFHPGVWAKNFALAALGKSVGAAAINLIVDGDVLDRPTIRVPTGTIGAPRVEEVAFDGETEPMPYESRRIADRATFESFGRRASEVVRPLVKSPLLETFWPLVLDEAKRSDLIGECFARARHRLEDDWGLETLELPQSAMCELPSFGRFTSRLLADLPAFHEAHNGALDDYRRAEKIRSAGRPVPRLVHDGEWWETPFWVATIEEPRRRRAFARRVGNTIELTDRGQFTVKLSLTSEPSLDGAAAALAELPRRGIKLRSRALITTMFARFVLGAPFIHGIGGGKYDELTDEIAHRFGVGVPPPFAVVTATKQLPIARTKSDKNEPATLRHRLWELDYHPETFLDGTSLADERSAEAARLAAEKRRLLVEGPPAGSARAWCQAIRAMNAELRRYVAEIREKNAVRLGTTCRQLAAEAVLASREYSSFLFPEKDLRDFLLAIGSD